MQRRLALRETGEARGLTHGVQQAHESDGRLPGGVALLRPEIPREGRERAVGRVPVAIDGIDLAAHPTQLRVCARDIFLAQGCHPEWAVAVPNRNWQRAVRCGIRPSRPKCSREAGCMADSLNALQRNLCPGLTVLPLSPEKGRQDPLASTAWIQGQHASSAGEEGDSGRHLTSLCGG